MTKSIAIIMPVFNGISFTEKAIKFIYAGILEINPQQYKFELVVVDDNSSDGTSDNIRRNFPEVHLLKGDGNLWWGGGINKGAKFAIENLNATYILLWNNDIQNNGEYFKNLVNIIELEKRDIIIGSKILSDTGIIWSMGGLFNPKTGKRKQIGINEMDSQKYSNPLKVNWLPGMGTLVPANVIKKIGYWDNENFPQYHGDVDFTFRAYQAGFDIMVYPRLIIYNDTTNSGLKHNDSFKMLLKSLTSIKSNNNIKKDILFYNKHCTSPFAYFALFVKYFELIGGFFKWKLLKSFGLKRPNKIKS